MTYLAVLGRQPKISLAELESRFGAKSVVPVSKEIATVEAEDAEISVLGGVLKFARVIDSFKTLDWPKLLNLFTSHSQNLAPGKISFGISVYGQNIPAKQVFAHSIELKKRLQLGGRVARAVPNQQPALNTATIIHNGLISKGAEWIIAVHPDGVIAAQTVAVQDIEAYGRRDYGRPERSAKVGMLPPKLAQILINLATPPMGGTVLDPFCGTGVVLQEAALMGYQAYGSDIDADLVEMSRQNLAQQKLATRLETADATLARWTPPIDAVVTEGYLGEALTSSPTPQKLLQLQTEASDLTLSFLKNLKDQINPGTPVVMCLPAWRQSKGYARLQVIDQIQNLGYTRKQFEHAESSDLLYYRENQIVARELVCLERS